MQSKPLPGSWGHRIPRARTTYFEAGPPQQLVASTYWGGRPDQVVQFAFKEGTPHGDYALDKVRRNQAEFYPNLDEDAPPGFDDFVAAGARWKTCISVPVVAGNVAYGLLTVDSLSPGDLSALDLDVLRVVADVVAAAMATTHDP
ncbi:MULTISPECIES: GAF domain-containing protein [Mycobacterium]|uniref:GAF domain-containing protein n=1 Tax=Mycobacterium TaxID=1763 RepID=UPI00351D2DEF